MEVYTIQVPPGARVSYACPFCAANGHDAPHPSDRVAMVPGHHLEGGNPAMVCMDHLPDDVVIYDPSTNQCRDKTGQNVWTEK